MQTDLAQVVKEAMETSVQDFCRLVEKATLQLKREKGKVGSLQVFGRLIKIKPLGEALVIGDLHGDLESLVQILQESRIIERMKESQSVFLVFLGDYGDRGEFSAQIYYTVLQLKLQHLAQVILMRGNHEGPKDLLAIPHDLPTQFQDKFGADWKDAYDKIFALFDHLYTSVLVEERFFIVHGGLPQKARTLEDFAFAHEKYPKQRFLEDMLWSDPVDSLNGIYPSPRGAGNLFGEDVTNEILKSLGAKVLIRGHESCNDGFKTNHDGRVLTLFSRKGVPYFNEHGAYLDVRLSDKFSSAEQLLPYVHEF